MNILDSESVISLIDLPQMTYGTCFEERKKVVHVLLQIIQQTHLKTLHTSKGKRDASDRLAKIVQ